MIGVDAEVWDRVDVSGWPVLRAEQAGSTENLWLEEPATEHRWLHKDTVIPQNGLEQGEDWSEVISTEVAKLLGVPCAPVRLCERNGRRGSLSLSVVPEGHDLWEGTVILERADAPGYFSHREGAPGVDPARPDVNDQAIAWRISEPCSAVSSYRQGSMDLRTWTVSTCSPDTPCSTC